MDYNYNTQQNNGGYNNYPNNTGNYNMNQGYSMPPNNQGMNQNYNASQNYSGQQNKPDEPNYKKYYNQIYSSLKTAGGSTDIFSITDALQKVTEKDDEPFLNVLSPKSIYVFSIRDGKKNRSFSANLKTTSLPLIKKRVEFAERMILLLENLRGKRKDDSSKESGAGSSGSSDPAFQPLSLGVMKGKIPGDMILEAVDKEAVITQLMNQRQFLLSQPKFAKQNAPQVQSIDNAINYYRQGILEKVKNGGNTVQNNQNSGQIKNMIELVNAISNNFGKILRTTIDNFLNKLCTITIYSSPVKYFKQKKDQADNIHTCYTLSITCNALNEYPYSVEIMNVDAPVLKKQNGLTPIALNQGKDKDVTTYNLSEEEFLLMLDKLDKNTEMAKLIWYNDCRNKAMNYRSYQ